MKLELTDTQRLALVEAIEEDLAYVHETLRDSHGTMAGAMTAFDCLPLVEVLCQLDRGKYARLRRAVYAELDGYLDP